MQNFLVAKLAKEEIAPLVRKMEKEGKIDDAVVRTLFENGVSFLSISVVNYYTYKNICRIDVGVILIFESTTIN